MQSPHLIDARVLRGSFDNWFMRLVYSYEDEKGVHKVIFPKVDFPFPTFRIPEPYDENSRYRRNGDVPNWDYCGTRARISNNPDTFISPLPIVKLQEDTDRLAKSRGVDTPGYAFDIVTEPAVHEMTLDEIEEKLGYKVKIVNKENGK